MGKRQGETGRARGLEFTRLLSQMDIYLDGSSNAVTGDVMGLFVREKTWFWPAERESRYRQRKISSINQA